jgi:CMP-N,N'-diacetyllegionaminic acid synthase
VRALAVIPARGGSKGLPGKNILPLAGLPLIAHSIRCAARAKGLARVVVSTDSVELAAVARQHGGEVPFLRPAELARDDTPMLPVLVHALGTIEKLEGKTYDALVLLDPTSPGRLPDEIDAAIQMLADSASAVGVVACSRPTFNPFWVGVVERNGLIAPAFPGFVAAGRRQDVPPFFRINGALYVWRASFIRSAPTTWRDLPHRMLEIPESRAFSIDDQHEFDVAQSLIGNGLIQLPWLEVSR